MAVEVRYSGQTVYVNEPASSFVYARDYDYGTIGIQSYIRGGGNAYHGEYEATPMWSEQIFATGGCNMEYDFTVHTILKQEVSNEAGGLTLSI